MVPDNISEPMDKGSVSSASLSPPPPPPEQRPLSSSSPPPLGQVIISDPTIQPTLPKLKYGYRTTPMTWKELEQIIHIGDRDRQTNNYNYNPDELAKLSRSISQQTTYQIFQHYMKQQYVSSIDYLLISKFGFDGELVVVPTTTNNDKDDEQQEEQEIEGGDVKENSDDHQQPQSSQPPQSPQAQLSPPLHRWKATPSLSSPTVKAQTLLLLNDFPYYVEDNVEHYVFWKLKGTITTQELDSVISNLKLQQNQKNDTTTNDSDNNNGNNNNNILYWTNPPNLQSLPDIDHVHILVRR